MKTLLKIFAITLALLILGSVVLSLVGGIKTQAFMPWLDGENASNVAKVEIISATHEIPVISSNCFYTTDKELIKYVLDWYGNSRISPAINLTDPGLYFAGFSDKIIFTFNDGSTKTINVSNGYFVALLFKFDINSSSNFDTQGMKFFSRFNLFDDSYKIYTASGTPTLVKEVEKGASDIFLEKYDGEADKTNATHYIEADFGRIYIISDKLCYFESAIANLLTVEDGYYTLYGSSFDEMIK